MSTKFKQNVQIAGEINATTIVGDGSGLTNVAGAYTNSDVDLHLNQSNPTAGYVLTWNGTDYSWTANGTGAGLGDVVDDITPQLGGTLDVNDKLIQFGDSSGATVNRLQFGADQDLSIYHDGVLSYITNKTGNFLIGANDAGDVGGDLILRAKAGEVDTSIRLQDDGFVQVYSDGTISAQFHSSQIFLEQDALLRNNKNLVFEGATNDDYETTLTATDPTDDRTITLPDATGTVLLTDGDGSNLTNVTASSVQVTESSDDNVIYNVLFSDTGGTGNVQMTPVQDDGGLTFNPYNNNLTTGSIYLFTNGFVQFEGTTNNSYETTLNVVDPTADRTIQLPDASGTVVLDGTLNASIDTHLNQANPTSGYVLSWNGSDYAWVVNNGTVFDLIQDTTPQLGGDLDANGKNISFGDSATPGTDDTLSFGADNDLQIYHNSSDGHNYMQLNDKRLYIKAVDDGLTGPFIIFDHETTNPTTLDFSTVLAATSRDSAGASQTISQITFGTPNVTSGSFRGSLRFDVTDSNGLSEYVRLDGNSDIIDLKKAVRFSEAFTFPTTDGSPNQVLQTNGSGVVTWATVSGGGGGGTPGGSNTEVQFNNAGAFGGDSDFTYNSTTNVLTVGSIESNAAGTPTITSNSAVNISVGSSVIIQKNSGGGGFRLGNLTTTERNALSSANGEMIYNTTDNKLQGYENGSWTNLIGSGTYSNSDVDAHLNQSNPTSGYVLSWNGSDYAWVTNAGGGGLVDLVDDTTPQLGGDLQANGNNIYVDTGDYIYVGNGTQGLNLVYNTNGGYVQNSTYDLHIRNYANDKDITLENDNGSGGVTEYVWCRGSTGAVELNHYGNKKLETTSTGVQTTGEINVNGAYSLPTAIGTSGQVLAVPNSGTVLEFVNSGGGGGGGTGDITFSASDISTNADTMNFKVDANNDDTGYEGYYFYGGPTSQGYVRLWTNDAQNETAIKFHVDGTSYYTAMLQRDDQFKMLLNEHGGNIPARIYNMANGTSGHLDLGTRHADGKVRVVDSWTGSLYYALPRATPNNGDVLTASDASGTLAWSAPSGGGLANVVDDTTPQLGGTLDTAGQLIQFGDSSGATVDRLQFGASQDVNMYHDGTDTWITHSGSTTSSLIIQNLNTDTNTTDGIRIETIDNSALDNYVHLTNNAGVRLGVSGSDRVSVISTGAFFNTNIVMNGSGREIHYRDTTGNGDYRIKLVNEQINDSDKTITIPNATGTVMLNTVDDTTPQLGGNLDVNGKDIVSASNGNIEIKPDGTGNVYMQFDDPDAGELIINKPPTTDTDTLLLQDCHQVWNTTATSNGTAVALALHPGTDSGSSQAITFLRAVRGQGDRGNFEINCKKYNVHGYHKTVFYGGETNTTNHIDNGRVEFPGNIKLKTNGPASTNFDSAKVGARNVFQITAPNAPNHYTFNDPESHWFPTAKDDPLLYLRRGETYYFEVNASGHPFEIRDSTNQIYNTGVTNNTTAVGTIIWKVPMEASSAGYKYVCTSHPNMNATIYIV